MACRPVASTTLSDSLDVLQPRSVGDDLFQVQCSAFEFLSLGHAVPSLRVDLQSTTEGMPCGATPIPFRSNLRAE